jgi:hypothetical protein
MSQIAGASQSIATLAKGRWQADAARGNYCESIARSNKNDRIPMSAWQRAVSRCLSLPVVPVPRKTAQQDVCQAGFVPAHYTRDAAKTCLLSEYSKSFK